MTAPGGTVRLAEVLAALSLATDIGNGLPLEKSLRNAVLGARFGAHLGLEDDRLSDVYYLALLRSMGCTAFAHENAALLAGDDIAFHAVFQRLDPGHPLEFLHDVATDIGAWAPPPARIRTVARFLRSGPTVAPRAARSACEVSVGLARRLGLSDGVVRGLDQVYERWDGKGIPDGLEGDALTLEARIVHLVDIVELAHQAGGPAAAVATVRRRRGGHLDPELADAFAPELLDELGEGDVLAVALDAEPGRPVRFPRAELDRFARAFAHFVDLKSPWTLGHSGAVADLAEMAGLPDDREQLRLAGLLHDLGRTSVPNGIWDKPGRLSSVEWERVRLHPYYTERILSRTPPFAGVASLAGAHHERLDGSGYHRGLEAPSLTPPMRLLAAADVYAAMTQDRPHRRALDREAAASELRAEVAAGRLCPSATEAVLEAAGHRPERRAQHPCDLTDREVQVLGLLARGLTNKQIAAELVVSPRTVQHHVAHVYSKIDRRTRAGAALFAMENGLAK